MITDHFNEVEIFGVVSDPNSVQKAIEDGSPDVLFVMDSLENDNSFDFINKLPSDMDSHVVYVTNSEKNVVSAMRLGIKDFLMNPSDGNEVKALMNDLISRRAEVAVDSFAKYKNKLLINKIDKAVIIDISNILYMEADGPYTNFIMNDKTEVKSSKSMGYYLKLLSDMPNLMRVNRSIVVNFEHIKEIVKGDQNEGTLILSNGQTIAFSASVKNRLLQNITETLSQYFRV